MLGAFCAPQITGACGRWAARGRRGSFGQLSARGRPWALWRSRQRAGGRVEFWCKYVCLFWSAHRWRREPVNSAPRAPNQRPAGCAPHAHRRRTDGRPSVRRQLAEPSWLHIVGAPRVGVTGGRTKVQIFVLALASARASAGPLERQRASRRTYACERARLPWRPRRAGAGYLS